MTPASTPATQPKPVPFLSEPDTDLLKTFHVGVNLPWVQYGCDFGANAWRTEGGIGRRESSSRLAKTLAEIRARGARVLRWFWLCDGRAGIRFERDGTPAGVDSSFWRDADAAMVLLADHDLKAVPVLFDFHWCKRRRNVNGVSLGGHARVLRDLRRREALLAQVVEPLLARYGRSPAIAAWDVMNEPEQVTKGFGRWSLNALSREAMRSFLLQTVARIHGHTQHMATVGLASLRGLPLVRDIGLDFYQVHWYDKVERRSPLATAVATMQLDRPVVLGEFPTVNSRHSAGEILRVARQAGYGGAWCWSALAEDLYTAGSLPNLRV